MSKDIPYRLLDPKVIEDPYPFYSALPNHAPVYQLHDTNVYLVSSWQLIHQLLKNQHDYTVNLTGILMSGSESQPELFDFSQFGGTVDALANADEPFPVRHTPSIFVRRPARLYLKF